MSSSFFSGPFFRPMRMAWALFLVFILSLALSVMPGSTSALATSQPAAEAQWISGIEIKEFSPALITPGDEIKLRVTVTNHTEQVITDPNLSFNVMRYRFSSRTALNRWETQELNANAGTPFAVNELGDTLDPGEAITSEFTVDSNDLQLLTGFEGWGPRGMSVLLTGTNEDGQVKRFDALFSYLLWNSAPKETPVNLSLTTVAVLGGPALNPMDPQTLAETIGEATSEGSRLSNVVSSLRQVPNLNIGVDPQLLEHAHQMATLPLPESVQAEQSELEFEPTVEQRATFQWVDALTTLMADNKPYALPDYDADLGAMAANGIPFPASNPRAVAGLPNDIWRTGMLWPEPSTLTQEFLKNPGTEDSMIIAAPGSAISQETLTFTPGAITPNTQTSNSTIVVADEILSNLVINAKDSNPVAARQRIISELAVIAKERPSEQRNIVLALPRAWDPNPAVARAQLGAIATLPWLNTPSLKSMVLGAEPSAQRYNFAPSTLATELLSAKTYGETAAAAQELGELAAVVPDPDLLAGAVTQSVQAITSISWRAIPTGRDRLASEVLNYTETRVSALSVDTGSDINLISTGSEIPLTVRNQLDQEASVLVQLKPDSARLQADTPVAVTIPAGGSQQVRVPVTAVGSGNVEVEVLILAASGKLATESGSFTVRVRADWENMGTAVVISLLVLILGAGIIRTVRRGKSKRRTDPKDASQSLQAVQDSTEKNPEPGERDH